MPLLLRYPLPAAIFEFAQLASYKPGLSWPGSDELSLSPEASLGFVMMTVPPSSNSSGPSTWDSAIIGLGHTYFQKLSYNEALSNGIYSLIRKSTWAQITY